VCWRVCTPSLSTWRYQRWPSCRTTLHYTTLHYTTLHYTTLHYTTLHYTTLHYTTLPYPPLHYTTLHYTTLHYTTLAKLPSLPPPPLLCCSLTSLCDGFLVQAEFTVKGSGAEAILTDVVVHQTAIAEHPTLRSHKVTVVAVSTDGSLIFEQDVVIKAQVGA
jgi:hypothetical protein